MNAPCCPNSHPLQSITTKPNHYTQWVCDVCQRNILWSGDGVTLSCHQCEFDICEGCARTMSWCPLSHPLCCITVKPIRYSGWNCDVCRKDIDTGNPGTVRHCGRCEFDVCQNCSAQYAERTRLKQPPPLTASGASPVPATATWPASTPPQTTTGWPQLRPQATQPPTLWPTTSSTTSATTGWPTQPTSQPQQGWPKMTNLAHHQPMQTQRGWLSTINPAQQQTNQPQRGWPAATNPAQQQTSQPQQGWPGMARLAQQQQGWPAATNPAQQQPQWPTTAATNPWQQQPQQGGTAWPSRGTVTGSMWTAAAVSNYADAVPRAK